jgi:dicarboxylate transporter 10
MQTLQSASGSVPPSTIYVIRSSISRSGFRSLYAGLTASLMRQMSYSMVRLGSYEKMKEHLSKDGRPSTLQLLFAASLAGGLGGIAGNPAGMLSVRLFVSASQASDIVLVRMTSDLIRQPDKRYNYSNAITGLISLIKTEGSHGLGRGIGTNTVSCGFHHLYLRLKSRRRGRFL